MIRFDYPLSKFVWNGPFEERERPEKAGFEWNDTINAWTTGSPFVAALLADEPMDDNARRAVDLVRINAMKSNLNNTMLLNERIPGPAGRNYLPFQEIGIQQLSRALLTTRPAVCCFDEMGLGKTIQAIGVANNLGFKKLLVICPAFLRYNWLREINKWHLFSPGVNVINSGTASVNTFETHVSSYELSHKLDGLKPDLIIVDESHYLKTAETKRTRIVLGSPDENWEGLVNEAPTIFLSGTPLPNGKPSELYPIINRCAPEIIDGRSYWEFIKRFCILFDDGYDFVIKGAKRTKEFHSRLRGSRFMIRRKLTDVLQDMPPIRFKMAVFPPYGQKLSKVLEQESRFSAADIIRGRLTAEGVSALPQIRRQMGIAKAPVCAQYIQNMLESGVEKIPAFCYHRDVIAELEKRLRVYQPMVIHGSVPVSRRQEYVDRFQESPYARLLICQSQAGGEGFNMQAANNVVLVEPSWTPKDNEQVIARVFRYGQTNPVLVHYLVVDGSLDAQILSTATNKQSDADLILDR